MDLDLPAQTLDEFLARIKGSDKTARAEAVAHAGQIGPPAIVPLGKLVGGSDPAAARAALEALRRIVHFAARPGAHREAVTASNELAKLIGKGTPDVVRHEAIALVGAVGSDAVVPAVAALLNDPDYREEARTTLERIPGRASEEALKTALKTAPADFRSAIQTSLRRKHVNWRSVGTGK